MKCERWNVHCNARHKNKKWQKQRKCARKKTAQAEAKGEEHQPARTEETLIDSDSEDEEIVAPTASATCAEPAQLSNTSISLSKATASRSNDSSVPAKLARKVPAGANDEADEEELQLDRTLQALVDEIDCDTKRNQLTEAQKENTEANVAEGKGGNRLDRTTKVLEVEIINCGPDNDEITPPHTQEVQIPPAPPTQAPPTPAIHAAKSVQPIPTSVAMPAHAAEAQSAAPRLVLNASPTPAATPHANSAPPVSARTRPSGISDSDLGGGSSNLLAPPTHLQSPTKPTASPTTDSSVKAETLNGFIFTSDDEDIVQATTPVADPTNSALLVSTLTAPRTISDSGTGRRCSKLSPPATRVVPPSEPTGAVNAGSSMDNEQTAPVITTITQAIMSGVKMLVSAMRTRATKSSVDADAAREDATAIALNAASVGVAVAATQNTEKSISGQLLESSVCQDAEGPQMKVKSNNLDSSPATSSHCRPTATSVAKLCFGNPREDKLVHGNQPAVSEKQGEMSGKQKSKTIQIAVEYKSTLVLPTSAPGDGVEAGQATSPLTVQTVDPPVASLALTQPPGESVASTHSSGSKDESVASTHSSGSKDECEPIGKAVVRQPSDVIDDDNDKIMPPPTREMKIPPIPTTPETHAVNSVQKTPTALNFPTSISNSAIDAELRLASESEPPSTSGAKEKERQPVQAEETLIVIDSDSLIPSDEVHEVMQPSIEEMREKERLAKSRQRQNKAFRENEDKNRNKREKERRENEPGYKEKMREASRLRMKEGREKKKQQSLLVNNNDATDAVDRVPMVTRVPVVTRDHTVGWANATNPTTNPTVGSTADATTPATQSTPLSSASVPPSKPTSDTNAASPVAAKFTSSKWLFQRKQARNANDGAYEEDENRLNLATEVLVAKDDADEEEENRLNPAVEAFVAERDCDSESDQRMQTQNENAEDEADDEKNQFDRTLASLMFKSDCDSDAESDSDVNRDETIPLPTQATETTESVPLVATLTLPTSTSNPDTGGSIPSSVAVTGLALGDPVVEATGEPVAAVGPSVVGQAANESDPYSIPTSRVNSLAPTDYSLTALLNKVTSKHQREATRPARVITPLMRHQRQSLAFMQDVEKSHNVTNSGKLSLFESVACAQPHALGSSHRGEESYHSNGGWLASESGTGKTLVVIALVASDGSQILPSLRVNSNNQKLHAQRKIKATVVITSLSELGHWENEVRKHAPNLKCYRIHSSKSRTGNNLNPEELSEMYDADIIVTTGTSHVAKTLGIHYEFNRVVIDQAHLLGYTGMRKADSITSLCSQRRWCVTATPFGSSVFDLSYQRKFLGICSRSPFLRNPEGKDSFNETLSQLRPFMIRHTIDQCDKEMRSLQSQQNQVFQHAPTKASAARTAPLEKLFGRPVRKKKKEPRHQGASQLEKFRNHLKAYHPANPFMMAPLGQSFCSSSQVYPPGYVGGQANSLPFPVFFAPRCFVRAPQGEATTWARCALNGTSEFKTHHDLLVALYTAKPGSMFLASEELGNVSLDVVEFCWLCPADKQFYRIGRNGSCRWLEEPLPA